MAKVLSFLTLVLSVFSLMCTQECIFFNNTNSKVTITIAYKQLTSKPCITKTVYLSPKQKDIISETQQDCLPYFFSYTAMDGALVGKSGTYEVLLPISNSFTFTVNEGPNNLLFFDIKQMVHN